MARDLDSGKDGTKPTISRRNLLEIGWMFVKAHIADSVISYVAGVASGKTLEKTSATCDLQVRDFLESHAPFLGEPSTSALRLLGMDSRDLFFHAGPGHPMYSGLTHPADLAALVTIASAVGLQRLYSERRIRFEEAVPTDLGGTKLLFGGPTSQALARAIYEYDGEGDSLRRRSDAILKMPFEALSDESQTERQWVLLPGGNRSLRPVWGFSDWEGQIHRPVSMRDGRLEKDILVLTRMRNFLADDWEDNESYLVHVIGASDVGAGTRAVESLIRDDELASNLESVLGSEYSVLFDVHDIPYRDDDAGVGRLSVRKFKRLEFDRSVYTQAHERVRERLRPQQPGMGG
jgi:hypothetical protein